MKGLKGFKGQQAADYSNARDSLVTHLENIFSRFPFSDPTNVMDDLGSLELKLGSFPSPTMRILEKVYGPY